MFKSLLLLAILSYHSINCMDLCSLVSSDGNYTGLGMYHRFHKDYTHYVMFNRFGKEWFFKVTPNFDIEWIENSVTEYDSNNVINRFSVFQYPKSGDYVWDWSQCQLTSNPGTDEMTIKCERGYSDIMSQKLEIVPKKLFQNRVILRAEPHLTREGSIYVMMYDKDGPTHDYNPIVMNGFELNYHECRKDWTEDWHKRCSPEPPFVNQMNSSLFKSIEGVVDYNDENSKTSGHLLLLNISGRPMICFTPEGGDISEECNSASKMRPLLPECFKRGLTVSTPTRDTTSKKPNDSPMSTTTMIVLGVIALLIILASIVIIVCLMCNENPKKSVFQGLKPAKRDPFAPMGGNKISQTKDAEPLGDPKSEIFSVKSGVDYSKPIPLKSNASVAPSSESIVRPTDLNVKPKPK